MQGQGGQDEVKVAKECGRLNDAPQRCPHPQNPYVTLHGKRAFADAIKLRTLRWGD